jgi:hypothetical protein
MKRINEGDWVFCPGAEGPVKVQEKESQYLSGVGRRTVYKVDIGIDGYLATYTRDDLVPTRYSPDETPPGVTV